MSENEVMWLRVSSVWPDLNHLLLDVLPIFCFCQHNALCTSSATVQAEQVNDLLPVCQLPTNIDQITPVKINQKKLSKIQSSLQHLVRKILEYMQ